MDKTATEIFDNLHGVTNNSIDLDGLLEEEVHSDSLEDEPAIDILEESYLAK